MLDVGSTYSGATTVSITSTSGADSVVYTHSPTSFIASKDDGTYQSKFELGATGLVHIQSEEPGSGNPQADLFFNPSSHGSGGIILRFTPDFPANSQEIAMLSTGIRIVENFANAGLYYNADYNTQGIINHGNRWIPDVGYISGSYAKLDGSSITGSFTGSFIGDGSGLTGLVSSSYALTASYVENAQTASYVETAQTASYVTTAQTASYVETSQYSKLCFRFKC